MYDRSIRGVGSTAFMVDALSAEATLVSRSLLSDNVSEVDPRFEWDRSRFWSAVGGRVGCSMNVFIGSGCGECLSLCRFLSLANIDLFSPSLSRLAGAGLEFRARVVDELIGVELGGVFLKYTRLLVDDSRLVDGLFGMDAGPCAPFGGASSLLLVWRWRRPRLLEGTPLSLGCKGSASDGLIGAEPKLETSSKFW